MGQRKAKYLFCTLRHVQQHSYSIVVVVVVVCVCVCVWNILVTITT